MIFHTSCRCCINVCKQTGESHVQGWRLHWCLLTSGPLRSPLSSHALLSWDTASRFSRIKMQLPAEIQHGSRYLERNRIILKQFINKIAILVTDAGTKETVCLPGLKLNYIIFKKITLWTWSFCTMWKHPPPHNRPPLTTTAPTVCARKFLSTLPPRKTNYSRITSSPRIWAGLRASKLAVPTKGRETEAAEMAQWVKMLAARPAGMSSIPGAHVVKGENQLPRSFMVLHPCCGKYTCTLECARVHTHTLSLKCNKN